VAGADEAGARLDHPIDLVLGQPAEIAGGLAGADHGHLLGAATAAAGALGRAGLAGVDLALGHEVALDAAAAARAARLAAAGGAGAVPAVAKAGARARAGAEGAELLVALEPRQAALELVVHGPVHGHAPDGLLALL